MQIWQAIVVAIVEGLTEFLPISSTGHMIIVNHFLGIGDDPFVKTYSVAIQFGAILAAVFLFKERFLKDRKIYAKLLVAFIPAGAVGFLLKKKIELLLGSVTVVAVTTLVGGIIIILIEKYFHPKNSKSIESLTPADCIKIGFLQCLALVPGTSRSAATIWGGLFCKLDRKNAAEFSFLLAVPTLMAASVFKVWQLRHEWTAENTSLLLLGNLVSFAVALLSIKAFVGLLQRQGMQFFGYYRILLGIVLLVLIFSGYGLSLE